jgi:hypothetical protein
MRTDRATSNGDRKRNLAERQQNKEAEMTSTLRPRRLQGDCITTKEIEAETLIYDERSHRAWCLNRSSACIWRLCDGRNTVSEVAALATAELGSAVAEDLVLLTLEDLEENGLLDNGKLEAMPRDPSRRQMLGRIGFATAALLPVIAGIAAPPAMAQSGSVGSDVKKGPKSNLRPATPTQNSAPDQDSSSDGSQKSSQKPQQNWWDPNG